MDDTQALNAIVKELYESISGPAGMEREWSRFATLLHPGARFIRTSIAEDDTLDAKVMDLEDYKDDTAAYFRDHSFYEAEVASRIDRFGSIAHVFSTYESRYNAGDVRPFKRGINSIQLLNDGSRWRVISVLWDNEREGLPIPQMYL